MLPLPAQIFEEQMRDADFLMWVAQRLVFVHGEDQGADFISKLLSIADALPKDQDTPNTLSFVTTT